MRKLIVFTILAIFLLSLVSAEIIINQQPKDFYNLGDFVRASFKIVTSSDLDLDTFFSIKLICNGIETEIMKQPIGDLGAGMEKEFNPPIPLLTSLLGRNTGMCRIKAVLESTAGDEYDYELTKDFEISDLIEVRILTKDMSFKPGEEIILEGEAIKKNGEPATGVAKLKIVENNQTYAEALDTVKNGYFSLSFSMPQDIAAGQYLVNIDVYELYKTEETNKGFSSVNIKIEQIPTNLEILFEDRGAKPGTNFVFRSILRDQTGEKIESGVNITVKDNQGIVRETFSGNSDQSFELPIVYNEPPANWTIFSYSRGLSSRANFEIRQNEDVSIKLINGTVILTNIGNVIYNESLRIDIGNDSMLLDVVLGIDESKKYILTAPDGEYQIEVSGKDRKLFSEQAFLTGRVVDVREPSKGFLRHSFVWIFLILILGFVAFVFFKRSRNKSFFGRFIPGKRGENKKDSVAEEKTSNKESVPGINNRGELSLSIKGDKQTVSLICLKIKNLKELDVKKGAGETLQKVISVAEEKKGFTYENQDNLFFIFAPIKTKTFKNEKTAIDVAQKIKEFLTEYNKLAKQKIDFGVSLHSGQIVVKQEKDNLKFMSLGTLITLAKKISSLSEGDVLLSKEIKDKSLSEIKTEKQDIKGTEVYSIKRMRRNRDDDKKFISNFLKRIESEKK